MYFGALSVISKAFFKEVLKTNNSNIPNAFDDIGYVIPYPLYLRHGDRLAACIRIIVA